MTPPAKKTSATLSEIWRSWGMKQPAEEAKTQQQALTALGAHLRTGNATLVRAMQALLVDPERPGASKRALFGGFWKAVQDVWPTAGTGGNEDLLYLQAMLLAAWPDDLASPLPPALLSPWMHGSGRPRQLAELSKWRDARAAERPMQSATDKSGDTIDLSELEALQKTLKERPWKKLEAKKHTGNQSYYNQPINFMTSSFAEPLQNTINDIGDSLTRIAAFSAQSISTLQTQLTAPKETNDSRLQELLWWGQARYSHTAKLPFRRIEDPARVLWLAAREAAERAYDAAVEPAAAYLQETLASLGHSLLERRRLWDWIADIRPALQREPRRPLPAELKKLLEKDAFGAPITLLCVHPDVQDTVLRDSLGVRDDVELDRGEWSAWVLRELVFQHRWEVQ
jgi:hypothetical protein